MLHKEKKLVTEWAKNLMSLGDKFHEWVTILCRRVVLLKYALSTCIQGRKGDSHVLELVHNY